MCRLCQDWDALLGLLTATRKKDELPEPQQTIAVQYVLFLSCDSPLPVVRMPWSIVSC